MRYLKILVIFLIFLSPCCFADESPAFIKQLRGHLEYNENIEDFDSKNIYLEPEKKKFINIAQPQIIHSKALKLKGPDFDIFNSDLSKVSVFNRQEHAIKGMYGGVSETYGKFTFGTEYDSFIDDAEMVYKTGVFTRIDGKRTALTLTARTETGNSYSNYSDKIVIAPELKLTKRLSLLDIAQTDVKQTTQKNEIVLRYNPKLKNNYNDLFLEVGAGQTYREQDFVKSSLRFSTRFKF